MEKTEAAISLADLGPLVDSWLDDGEIRGHSDQTTFNRRDLLAKLEWWCQREGHQTLGAAEFRGFLAYVVRSHREPGGRWGNPRCTTPVKASTTRSYYNILRSFCAWLVEQGELPYSPLESVQAPKNPKHQVQPFTTEQVQALREAAARSTDPRRDEAIILFLLDTGARAGEAVGLRVEHVDLTGKRCRVLGKGSKERTLPFGRKVRSALFQYLRQHEREPHEPLFAADRGRTPGAGLTRSGLGQIIRRLGRSAGIRGVRCSPHTFRHTFAIEFLRSGGNVFTLQQLLGHESLEIVKRYVAIASADAERQHRQFSPADKLKR